MMCSLSRRLAFWTQAAIGDANRDLDQRLDYVSQRLLCRSLKSAEVAIVKESVNELHAYYKEHADEAGSAFKIGEKPVDVKLPAAELAAWTMLVNEMMNLDEVLNK